MAKCQHLTGILSYPIASFCLFKQCDKRTKWYPGCLLMCVFSFSECLIDLEPMVRRFDEIEFLEAVLQIKKSEVNIFFNLFMGLPNAPNSFVFKCGID